MGSKVPPDTDTHRTGDDTGEEDGERWRGMGDLWRVRSEVCTAREG